MGELTRQKVSIAISERAKKYIRKSKADSTLRVYKVATQNLAIFASKRGKDSLPYPPEIIVDYLSMLADSGTKVNTIQTYLAGIAWAHRTAGYADPTSYEIVKATMKGIRRVLLIAPEKKDPVDLDDLRT